jgi:hypothetical protein
MAAAGKGRRSSTGERGHAAGPHAGVGSKALELVADAARRLTIAVSPSTKGPRSGLGHSAAVSVSASIARRDSTSDLDDDAESHYGAEVAPPVVTLSEVIEPAAPGCTIGAPLRDDSLDSVVGAVPPLDESAPAMVADYASATQRWLLTDKALEQYGEFFARGLLMVRNATRCDARFVVTEHPEWLASVGSSLDSKQG